MTQRLSRRNLTLLASTSLIASVMVVLPLSVEVRWNRPVTELCQAQRPGGAPAYGGAERPGSEAAEADLIEGFRRASLARLGLSESQPYTSPVVVTLSQASAASGSGSGGGGDGGDGGGDSGDGGGDSGDGGGDSSGSGSGDSGDSSGSGSGDSGDSGDSSGPGSGSAGSSSGNSGPGGGSSASGGSTGASSGSESGGPGFGGVEQVGSDLSTEQEEAAISAGWQ